jgi:hypothetical protein
VSTQKCISVSINNSPTKKTASHKNFKRLEEIDDLFSPLEYKDKGFSRKDITMFKIDDNVIALFILDSRVKDSWK